MFPSNSNLETYFEELNTKSWTQIPFNAEVATQLLFSAKDRLSSAPYRKAQISGPAGLRPDIRSDQTFWLDAKSPGLLPVEDLTLKHLNDFMHSLKQYFRTPLVEFECHYSLYREGDFYQKHSDVTGQNNRRLFSFVIYLNPDWTDADGGQIVGYTGDAILFKLNPEIGTMLLFKSELQHEVLPTAKPRYALTGWLRR